MSAERPVAAIDIGSNSVFLQVVSVHRGRAGRVLERVKHRARLGAALGADGRLDERAVELTVQALRGFAEVIDRHDAEVRATATAAVRRASNGGLLLQRIRAEAGIDVELISGQREAELVFLGVQAARSDRGPVLCADVGGGSSELVSGQGDAVHAACSLPIGAVTLAHPSLMAAPVSAASLRAARAQVASALARIDPASLAPWEVAIATSGSAQRLARLVVARRRGSARADVDGVVFDRADLEAICGQLARASSHAERLAMPGMDPERADVLLGGALIFDALSEHLGVERWRVSMAGLRAGLVEDVLRRRRAAG